MSTGFEFSWERAAMRGEEMPDGLRLADQLAYQALRYVYAAYRDRRIDRDVAAKEKMRIRMAHEDVEKKISASDKLAAIWSERYRRTEIAATNCRKEPTEGNVMRLLNVLDGLER